MCLLLEKLLSVHELVDLEILVDISNKNVVLVYRNKPRHVLDALWVPLRLLIEHIFCRWLILGMILWVTLVCIEIHPLCNNLKISQRSTRHYGQ
jgi:hypothetical protein